MTNHGIREDFSHARTLTRWHVRSTADDLPAEFWIPLDRQMGYLLGMAVTKNNTKNRPQRRRFSAAVMISSNDDGLQRRMSAVAVLKVGSDTRNTN